MNRSTPIVDDPPLTICDMQMNERLKVARVNAGFESARQAAEAMGIPPSTYAAHENGTRGLGIDEVEAYARRFRVSREWLAFGKGDAAAPLRVENHEKPPSDRPLIPVFDVRASAGEGALVDYEDVTYSLAFPPSYLKRITSTDPRNLTIISVKGDSMEPTLSDDDIVMLDMSKTSLGYEGLFVIRIYDVLHVKRLSHSRPGRVLVISDNRDKYPPREHALEDIEVVGKVLWTGGKV